jgi:hypothetical protein
VSHPRFDPRAASRAATGCKVVAGSQSVPRPRPQLPQNLVPLPTAGAPPANASFFCTAAACYSYINKQLTNDQGKKLCGAMGGTMVQYNSLEEQQVVESYFRWGSAAAACWPGQPAAPLRTIPSWSLPLSLARLPLANSTSPLAQALCNADPAVLLHWRQPQRPGRAFLCGC